MSEDSLKQVLSSLSHGIPFELIDENPTPITNYKQDPQIPHAPVRVHNLTQDEKKVTLSIHVNIIS